MNNVMLKIELLERIENKLGIQLDNLQVQFIFSDKAVSLYTTPRRYGKDTMITIRTAINAIICPGKRTLIASSNKTCSLIMKNNILDLINHLVERSELPQVESLAENSIRLNNSSTITFSEHQSFEYNSHGARLNEVIINELHSPHLREIFTLARCACLEYINGQVFMVGTPCSNDFLLECSQSEHIEHIQVLNRHVERLHGLIELRDGLDTNVFRHEILGEIF